jgi:hypothetical protein
MMDGRHLSIPLAYLQCSKSGQVTAFKEGLMSQTLSPPQARPAKKIVVRKAGPVRLTASANAAYIPWMCLPS